MVIPGRFIVPLSLVVDGWTAKNVLSFSFVVVVESECSSDERQIDRQDYPLVSTLTKERRSLLRLKLQPPYQNLHSSSLLLTSPQISLRFDSLDCIHSFPGIQSRKKEGNIIISTCLHI